MLGSATRMCVADASSSPPPITAPLSTETTGSRPRSIRSNARCHIRECCEALERVALGQLGQVEPGAEVLALGVEHDGLAPRRAAR